MRLNESAISTIPSTISSTELCWILFVPHMMTAFWRLRDDGKFLHCHKTVKSLSPLMVSKVGVSHVPGHNGKVLLDMNFIVSPY